MTDQIKGFKNHKEMWEHLLNGGRICLVSKPSVHVKMENGSVNTPYNIGAPAFWMPYEEPKWYENIPERGILCRVHNGPKGRKATRLVMAYKGDALFKHVDDYENRWEFAEPLTFEEAVDLIYKPLDT